MTIVFGFLKGTRKYEAYIEKAEFDDCVLAYRSNLDGKCNIQFAKEVFDEVKRRGSCTTIALDIKGYFDNIQHNTLKSKWEKVWGSRLPEDQFKIFNTLTKYTYVNQKSILKKYKVDLGKLSIPPRTVLEFVPGDKDFEKFKQLRKHKMLVVNDTGKGIPQGSALSSLLSNIYLIDYDKTLNDKAKKENFFYRRYCDDIMIVCDNDKAEALQKFAIDQICDSDLSLVIQDKKVEVIEFKKNSKGLIRAFNKKKEKESNAQITSLNEKLYYKSLQYLGFEFNGQKAFIRASSVSRYFRKMKSRIIKTVSMAYSQNGKSDKIWKAQLLERYTHLGTRNFIKYAYNASSPFYLNSEKEKKEGLSSPAIKKQVARHFNILLSTLDDKNTQRFLYKKEKRVTTRKKKA